MGSPAPRERPGRDPEANADRLKKRFRAVSRRIDASSPRAAAAAAARPHVMRGSPGTRQILAMIAVGTVAVLLAIST